MNAWNTEGQLDSHEGPNKILIVPRSGGKRRFPFVPFTNTDEVVGTTKVQFGENLARLSGSRAAETSGRGVRNLLVMSVERPVVDTGRRPPSFFLTKKNPADVGDVEKRMKPLAKLLLNV